ncbi:phage tail protein [Pantoea ananatis]|uniref:phage tail protein n=1 Tax=Pantoea ananas TaxID=553 RepID=UPI0013756293|nr:phage tail protein [Pantoea ananatis]NCU07421.1 phage tail protein [Pantoea ananatis]
MMMILGMMPFVRQTLPFDNLQHDITYRWAKNSRVGRRESTQFLGGGDDKIKLSGELRPEITGGNVTLLALKTMADEGLAWPLIGGNGIIYGMFVVTDFSATHTEFYSDGSARKIGFTLNLMRVDDSLTSMFGDLKRQAEELQNRVSDAAQRVGSVIKSATSALNGGR